MTQLPETAAPPFKRRDEDIPPSLRGIIAALSTIPLHTLLHCDAADIPTLITDVFGPHPPVDALTLTRHIRELTRRLERAKLDSYVCNLTIVSCTVSLFGAFLLLQFPDSDRFSYMKVLATIYAIVISTWLVYSLSDRHQVELEAQQIVAEHLDELKLKIGNEATEN